MAKTSNEAVVFLKAVSVSLTAVGGSLALVTVMETVAVALLPWPSVIVYVKVSVPWKFAAGV